MWCRTRGGASVAVPQNQYNHRDTEITEVVSVPLWFKRFSAATNWTSCHIGLPRHRIRPRPRPRRRHPRAPASGRSGSERSPVSRSWPWERLADRDGKSVDAVLARELLDVVSANSEYLATAIRASPQRFGVRARCPASIRNEGPTIRFCPLRRRRITACLK